LSKIIYYKQLKVLYTLINIMNTPNTETTQTMTYNGRVKWFNNKAGYGFITVVSTPSTDDSVDKNTDVFAHHSSIQVNEEQYRYLIQGEYVQFSLSAHDSGDHKYSASNISGIGGGALLCETRNDIKSTTDHSTKGPNKNVERRQNYRGSGPREDRGSGPREDRGSGPREDRGSGPREDRGSGPREDREVPKEEWVLTRRQKSESKSSESKTSKSKSSESKTST
jgi:cold shock CspA family protein